MKTVDLEFGKESFGIRVPDTADILRMPEIAPLRDPAVEVRRGLACPIECTALGTVIRAKVARVSAPTAAIVISDNTRPVPYTGPAGILAPLLSALRRGRVVDIVVLVATGTHHGLNENQLRSMLPETAFAPDVRIVNHDCTDPEALRWVGRTARGTDAWINAIYLDADIKILTGLVEPHFMAGFSGGRKSVCPGLVGLDATQIFHGVDMMADPRSDSLILDGNPCHEEALEVARLAGCDFLVNVTIDREKRLTGVFCGDMEAAHLAACERAAETNAIPIEQEYDVVVTHAGFAGINHYQAAKAGCEAAKAVKRGGVMILAASHTDVHPVGGPHYRQVLRLLSELGPELFNARLRSPDWTFVPEQWEVQKWAQVFAKLGGMENLIYCSPQVTGALFAECRVPGVDGGAGLNAREGGALSAAAMVQCAVDAQIARHPERAVAVLADGPYGVPRLRGPDSGG